MNKSKEKDFNMKNSSLSRRERKTQKTRETLLESAKSLFKEKDFDAIKMEEISERADLSRTTLYNHFKSKEDIYFEIGVKELQIITETQEGLINSEETGLKQLLSLSKNILETQLKEPLMNEITRKYLILNKNAKTPAHIILEKPNEGKEVEDPDSLQLANYLAAMRKFEKNWQVVIANGQKDGTINHQILNRDQLIHYLFLTLLGIIDRVQLERIALEKVKLTPELILKATLELIRKELE